MISWASKSHQDTSIGLEYCSNDFIMFFGNSNASLDVLQAAYPQLIFRFLKQVHGIQCLDSRDSVLEADAHFTNEKNVALGIRTADCQPLLIAAGKIALAIHSGWKGTLHEITRVSLEKLNLKASDIQLIAIGPHIQKSSFQVSCDLGHKFENKFGPQYVLKDPSDKEHSYVDLLGISKLQVREALSETAQIWSSPEDTLSSTNYFSHRREPQNAGRNLSFVARL